MLPTSARDANAGAAPTSGVADPLEGLDPEAPAGTQAEARALEILASARGTPQEAQALTRLLDAAPSLSDALRVETASLLATRGDEKRALEIALSGKSTPLLMLVADLAAQLGDLPRALSAIERVLARDIDAPGALERHEAWSQSLGAGPRTVQRNDEATLITTAPVGVPYRIEAEVARGGAGTVYRAVDEVLGRPLAFKVYHGGAADKVAIERELSLATSLAGPGIVRVLDGDPSAGWIALEWAPLGSIRDLLQRGAFEQLERLEWVLPLARGLARVHARGWVHSDVKPANVLLRGAALPSLTDFGIARVVGASSAGGSAGYVSPERIGAAYATPRDDVYGFGRILEDVFEKTGARQPALTALYLRCVGPAEGRPVDGAALVRALCEALDADP